MSELVYRPHAVHRMLLRSISHEIVKEVLDSPDGVIRQSFDKIISFKKFRGRKDNLIAVVSINKLEILTVMNYFEVKK